MTKEIYVSRPNLNYEAAKAVRNVIKSGWIVAGPKTHELESLVKKKNKI